jgi:O-antigen/teichoic acid export membrane protein
VIRRSLRIMVVSGGLLAAIALLIGAAGAWGRLLGLGGHIAHANLTATACIVIFALGLPLSLGQRALLGSGKNHIAIAAGVVQPAVTLALAVIFFAAHGPVGAFVLIYPLAMIAGSASTTLLAHRLTGLRLSVFEAVRPSRVVNAPRARVLNIALPMFLLSVGLPIGLQSDQLVISHRLSAVALSQYALCAQLYLPGWTVLSAAAYALMPVFTRRRTRGIPHRMLWLGTTAVFASVSAFVGIVFVLAAPFVAHLISSGHLHLGLRVRLAFAVLLVVQISSLVCGMMLNRPEELRFQAGCVMVMMVANVALSWWLAAKIGISGPVVASALTVGVCMLLPLGIRGWRTPG